MAHSGTTMDLGGVRPATNETAKRRGFSRAPVILTLGVAIGLAVGASAWAISTTRTTSTTNDAAAFGAVHEKIEAHQAAVAAGADRTNDQIEAHRTAAANAAAGALANSSYDQIEAHRTMVANQAAGVFDHRLDNIVGGYGLPAVTLTPSARGIVPDVAKTAPAWHGAPIVGTVTTPGGRASSQGIVLSPTPRVFDPGSEKSDARAEVPSEVTDYYQRYVDGSRVVVKPNLTGTRPTSQYGYVNDSSAAPAPGTSGYPLRHQLP